MADIKRWKLEDPSLGTLPVWSQEVDEDDEYRDDLTMCESDQVGCVGPMHWTSVEGDISILLCSKHVSQDLTPVTDDEYARLVAEQQ